MKKMTEAAIEKRMADFPAWEYSDGGIHTTLEFENFKDAFAMMTRIAFEAERLNHHPDWTNVYNKLSISLSTHDADGLTEKDFQLAEFIQEMLG
jgi:4a-hydroxytetrahydrobiopterin dehydratase